MKLSSAPGIHCSSWAYNKWYEAVYEPQAEATEIEDPNTAEESQG